jgi:hypothetical protein
MLDRFINTCDPEVFEKSETTWSVILSDQTTVDLIPNGRNIAVSYEERIDFL